jgi:(R,R)-butanediol dehydrogenase/meso-butanediol dehydrogenase/diacetyl reductase
MRLIGGGYAELAAVTARQCRRLPETVPLAEGALAEPVAVGMHCVSRSGMRPGATVLILGAGPIGLTVAFWARRLGAAQVIVADLNRHQEARAAALGATGFALSGPGLAEEVETLIGGAPDIVFECVGKRGLIAFATDLVRPRGTIVEVGLCVAATNGTRLRRCRRKSRSSPRPSSRCTSSPPRSTRWAAECSGRRH